MILAGDIGGTHTRLAFFPQEPAAAPPVLEVFSSREYPGLAAIARKFLEGRKLQANIACFGIAGPVREGRVETSNLPWVVDSRELAAELGIEPVFLINDLEANAYGIAALAASDFAVLNPGAPSASGSQALIAAGTGLGEAGLVWETSGRRPFPSEGGHADFAPRNEVEIELLRYLLARFDHVSYERVLSGPGLHTIYEFFRDTGRAAAPAPVAEEIAGGDAAAVISKYGLEGSPEICKKTLDLFVSIYGAEAGNLALKVMATGGVFIGGGIAPKILPKLREPVFLRSFVSKGRLRKVLEDIPVRVIMNDKAALLGAARFAYLSRRLRALRKRRGADN